MEGVVILNKSRGEKITKIRSANRTMDNKSPNHITKSDTVHQEGQGETEKRMVAGARVVSEILTRTEQGSLAAIRNKPF